MWVLEGVTPHVMKTINLLMKQLREVADAKKEIELKEKVIKESLLEAMKAERKDSVPSDYGTATIARRTYYTYSDVVKSLESKVKEKKIEEEEKGVAEPKVTEYILFKEPKSE